MSKLIFADIPRVLKSKILYVVLILTVVMGAASVLVTMMEMDESAGKALIFPTASNSLVMFMSIMMPIFSGGLSVMLIAAEFSSGIIRNKFIMGHTRAQILLSWGIIYTVSTILTYMLYVGTFFISLIAVGADFTGVDFGTVTANLLIVLMFALKFQMFSFLLVCIYPDAKSAVIAYILNNITIVPLMLASMSNEKSDAVKFLSRIFIFGYTDGDYTLMSTPDKPWLTLLMITVLGTLYYILAVLYFRKKDLK